MSMNFLHHVTDAVLRAPTLGSMLMCFAASQVGVIAFLRKQSLLGESLSHAAYPGVILGVIFAGVSGFDLYQSSLGSISIMIGAFLTASLGLAAIFLLINHLKVRADSALCFILSSFFGVGTALASHVQFTNAILYKQSVTYIYGQAATMTDIHILLYGALSFIVSSVVFLFYKELKTISFDQEYAKSLGMNIHLINGIVYFLIVLAVIIGMRSVGVILISAMFIAPAAAARQFTNHLSTMLLIAGCIGLASGYFGNYFAVEWGNALMKRYPEARIGLPTGPMIVLFAFFICLLSLLFAPQRGIIIRFVRIAYFRFKCTKENILKSIWRISPGQPVSIDAIRRYQMGSMIYLRWILWRLIRNGFLVKTEKDFFCLTVKGRLQAEKIVRLHRLWEVYLVTYVGVGVERVHRSAEEMEHVITPAIEEELLELLQYPENDPHRQPIPARREKSK